MRSHTRPEAVTSLDATFDGGSMPAGWTNVNISGDKAWYVTSFDNNYYAAMTGFKLPGTLASASASRMEVGSCTPMHLEASVQSAVGPSTRFVVAASARPKLVPASVVELPPVGMEPTMYPFTHTRNIDQCVVVALPAESALRQLGNLRDNPGNLGKEILINARFERYMGAYGLTGNTGKADEFEIDGVEVSTGEFADGDGNECC